MSLAEPTTTLTDWLVAALALFWSVRLLSRGRSLGRRPVSLWGTSLLCVGVAALAGGAFHGFAGQLGRLESAFLWKATVLAIGAADFCLAAAVIAARFRGRAQSFLFALAVVKLFAYGLWMAVHDEFRYVIYDYGLALLFVAGVEAWAWRRRRAAASPWILAGVGVSILAAAAQQSGFALHQHFNHNDLYHVIQACGLYLLYRGGRELPA